jgi:hypothetical protein
MGMPLISAFADRKACNSSDGTPVGDSFVPLFIFRIYHMMAMTSRILASQPEQGLV